MHRGGRDHPAYGRPFHPLDMNDEHSHFSHDHWDDETFSNGHFDGEAKNRSLYFDESDDGNRTYKSYPLAKYNTTTAFLSEKENWQDIHPAKRFSSVILAEEIESFNQIASSYTDDILVTIDALSASKEDDVLIETRYEMPDQDVLSDREGIGATDILINLFAHNFYIGELIGSIFQPTESP